MTERSRELSEEWRRLVAEARTLDCLCSCHARAGWPHSVKPNAVRCCMHIPWQLIDAEEKAR